MKTNRHTKALNLSNPRWLAYATACAATTLVPAPFAEAEIHYSGLIETQFHGKTGQSKAFPLLPGSALIFDRNINYTGTRSSSYNGANVHFEIQATNGSVAGFFYTCAFSTSVASVSNLASGTAISQRPFVPDGGILVTADGLACGGGVRGQFRPRGTGFIGFKFDRGQGAQYGWARIKKGPAPGNRFELVDYAFGDSGEAIRAGQKNSAGEIVSSVSRFNALALMAWGGAGLEAWRSLRNSAQPEN